jgi:hypothetical protein
MAFFDEIKNLFPIYAGNFSFECVSVDEGADDLKAVMRLIEYEIEQGQKSVRQAKAV